MDFVAEGEEVEAGLLNADVGFDAEEDEGGGGGGEGLNVGGDFGGEH